MPRLLDLFSGAGGAAVGYHRAGFDEIVGVDIKPMPRYPFTFVQADALEYVRKHGKEFDAIHASPPCQGFSSLKTMKNAKYHPDLLTPTRSVVQNIGTPYIIENVPGAPMFHPLVILCGTMFGLELRDGRGELRRHRIFEHSFPVGLVPPCRHRNFAVRAYGGGGNSGRRTVSVTGHAGGYSRRNGRPSFSRHDRKEAMGIDWMRGDELSQAIPPAYTEFIGKRLLEALARVGR